MKNTKKAFSTNQMIPGTHVKGGTISGGSQPPRNRIVAIAHMVQTATYSPSMNIMYGVEPYSTMKPATNSDSASIRSNGGRLVSASAETKKITSIGSSGNQYQFRMLSHGTPSVVARPRFCCASTIAVRLSEPTQSSTVMITKPIETSYDTICAAERSAARNGYFEFEAQPAMITPYTPSDEIAKM